MDVGKSITFVTEDPDWLTKLGLGGLISLVPILNFAWYGYLVEVMRNVAAGRERPLPDWSDITGQFMRGLYICIALLIYAFPFILATGVGVVVALIPAIFADQKFSQTLSIVSSGVGLLLLCLMCIYLLALSVFIPAVFINYSRQETFASCFQFGEIFRIITANFSDYVIASTVAVGIGFVVGVIGLVISFIAGWIPCLGFFVGLAVSAITGAWSGAIYAHLFGQVAAAPQLSSNS